MAARCSRAFFRAPLTARRTAKRPERSSESAQRDDRMRTDAPTTAAKVPLAPSAAEDDDDEEEEEEEEDE